MTRHPSVAALIEVARRLGSFREEVVFEGGCAVPILIPESVAATVRPTGDVDCVVCADSTLDYYRVGSRLRELGFSECRDEGAPLCRWVIDDIRVDVMPSGEAALGFRNRWYRQVLADPREVEVAPDLRIRVAKVPLFLATKFDAFADRGQGDHLADPDIEDIVTVIAWREDAVDLVLHAAPPVREYLAEQAQELLALQNLVDLVSGCLDPDAVSQSVVPEVIERLRRIAAP